VSEQPLGWYSQCFIDARAWLASKTGASISLFGQRSLKCDISKAVIDMSVLFRTVVV